MKLFLISGQDFSLQGRFQREYRKKKIRWGAGYQIDHFEKNDGKYIIKLLLIIKQGKILGEQEIVQCLKDKVITGNKAAINFYLSNEERKMSHCQQIEAISEKHLRLRNIKLTRFKVHATLFQGNSTLKGSLNDFIVLTSSHVIFLGEKGQKTLVLESLMFFLLNAEETGIEYVATYLV